MLPPSKPPRFSDPPLGKTIPTTYQQPRAVELFEDDTLTITKDVNTPLYEAGAKGDPHPDTETYPNHVLDTVIPNEDGNTAKWTYVRVRPPLVSYVRTGQGQVATVTETLVDADASAPAVTALTVDAKVENLANEKARRTVTAVDSVFGENLFKITKPDITPERFRVRVPTKTVSNVAAGTAEPPILTTGELSVTEEQITEQKVRMTVESRDTVELPISFVNLDTNRELQLVTITETLKVSAGTVDSITLVDGGFGYSMTPNVIFTGGDGTGAAATAVIDTSGVVTSVTMTSPGIGYTSPPDVSFDGDATAVASATCTIDLNATPPSATTTVKLDNLGDGSVLETVTEVPEVFSNIKYEADIANIIPPEFRALLPFSTISETLAGQAGPVSLPIGQVAASDEQLTEFTHRVSGTLHPTDALPSTLTDHEVTEEYGGEVLDIVKTLGLVNTTPIDTGEDVVLSETRQLGNSLQLRLTKKRTASEDAWPRIESTLYDEEMQCYYVERRQVVPAGSQPDAEGDNATATGNVVGGTLSSITITNGGSGYLNAPTVAFFTSVDNTYTATTQAGVEELLFFGTISGIGGILRNQDAITFDSPQGNLRSQSVWYVTSVNTGANTFKVSNAPGGAAITPDVTAVYTISAAVTEQGSTSVFVADSSPFSVNDLITTTFAGIKKYYVVDVEDLGHIQLSDTLGGTAITWVQNNFSPYQITPQLDNPPILVPVLVGGIVTDVHFTFHGSGLPSTLLLVFSDPTYGFISEVKAIDQWRSLRTTVIKDPPHKSVGTAIISTVHRPYAFPGLLRVDPNVVTYSLRKAHADLVQVTVRTWWVKSLTKPLVNVPDIITDSVKILDTSWPDINGHTSTSFSRVDNVLHDSVQQFLPTEVIPPTTPSYTEYALGTFSSSTPHNSITLSSGGSGYSVGDTLFISADFGSNFAQVRVTSVGLANSVFGFAVVAEDVGGTFTNPVAATGGLGSGAAFNVVAYSKPNYIPGTAWIGTERIIAAAITPARETNLWKVETQSTIMR